MKIKFAPLLLMTVVLAISCKKDDINPKQQTDIYISGTQWDSLSGKDVSGYWKNGVFTKNSLSSNYNHYGNAIALSGNDVYVTGFENRPTEWKCQVWKNGQHQYSLGDTYSEGRAISVSGTDVYVGCYLYEAPSTRMAAYWKNQLPPNILGTSSSNAQVNDIVVSGSDIYVAGYVNTIAKLWKNGLDMPLPNIVTGNALQAIAISGNDVYVTGNIGTNTIRYWKNNTSADINAPAGYSVFATDIAVDGNDVYIAGWESNGTTGTAMYWKNGTAVRLGDGIRNSTAWGISVKNGTVYVTGNSAAGSSGFIDYATLWENGVAKVIGTRNSRATAIAVK